MPSADHYGNPTRPEVFFNCRGNLTGKAFLDLETESKAIYQPGKFGDAYHSAR